MKEDFAIMIAFYCINAFNLPLGNEKCTVKFNNTKMKIERCIKDNLKCRRSGKPVEQCSYND